MENAKEEFLIHVESDKIKCAKIWTGDDWSDDINLIVLPVHYTKCEYKDFLKKLDFEYDSGYGGQNLFGDIWFMDDTWSSRGEYDGSEWWSKRKCPNIPTECKKGISYA